jgi:hypothetical protein
MTARVTTLHGFRNATYLVTSFGMTHLPFYRGNGAKLEQFPARSRPGWSNPDDCVVQTSMESRVQRYDLTDVRFWDTDDEAVFAGVWG